jgi:hypothetical protein
MALGERPGASDRRTRIHACEPPLQFGKGPQRILGALAHAGSAIEPAPGGDVGDRETAADDELASGQVIVENLIVPLRLAAVTIGRVVQPSGAANWKCTACPENGPNPEAMKSSQDSNSGRSSDVPRSWPVFSAR